MFGFGKKSVTLRHTDAGSHGDHWRAIFGFTDDGLGSRIESIVEDLQVSGTQRGINRVVARYDAFSALGIQSGNDLATLYPVAEQRETIAVTIREIIEWRHVGGLEAQIVGRGKDTFGLNFFAVDYFENQAAYLRGGPVTVQLAALSYLVEPAADLYITRQF